MKIRLSVSKERYQEIKTALSKHGIEIDDDSDLILSENGHFIDNIIAKDPISNERIILDPDDIVSVESFGHAVIAYTQDGSYQIPGRLYKVEKQLAPDRFLRISNSVIVSTNKIKKIMPTLSMKFILTMSNGRNVDVTRSYYYIFKEYFNI